MVAEKTAKISSYTTINMQITETSRSTN